MPSLTNQPKTWLLIISILIGALLGGWLLSRPLPVTPPQALATHNRVATAALATKTLQLEVAESPVAITQGLSDRAELGSDGMLFMLGQTMIPEFWMKDMQFDLDFIWLNNNQVVEITPLVPHPQPGTSDSALIIYSPKQPVDQVLELNAGNAQKWGVTVGDRLEFK